MNVCYLNLDGNLNSPALWVFWAACGLLAYAYAGYPILLAAISVFAPKRTGKAGYCPSVTVLISAYNEEKSIGRKIRDTLALDYPPAKLDILVVSDCSTDATDQVVRELRDPRVRLLRVEGRRGKTFAQNEGVRQCSGEVVVFSDATTVYHPQSIRRLMAHYADPKVGAVSGRYKYFDAEGASPTGLGSVAFWNYENLIKMMQSRIATLTGCSGCIYSVRKSCYVPLPQDACSDLVEALRIVENGFRVAFEPAALAYEETTVSSRQEFRMRVRVGTRGMRGVLGVPRLLTPWRRPWIAFQLTSHKIMRWLVPVFLVACFVSCSALAAQPLFRWLFALQVAFYGFALLSLVLPVHRYWKLLGLPLFFCTLNGAVAVSLVEVVRGRRYTTWETVRTGPAAGAVAATEGR